MKKIVLLVGVLMIFLSSCVVYTPRPVGWWYVPHYHGYYHGYNRGYHPVAPYRGGHYGHRH